MNEIRFRKEAEDDLRGIVEYYEAVAPASLGNILSDIERALQLLERHPRIGAPVPGRDFRRLVTRRYHFKLAHRVHGDLVIVLGVFRYQNRES